ncbi:MAG: tRNA 2-selenouridine(34) synthase MnmH [Bacteroidota bacterium]
MTQQLIPHIFLEQQQAHALPVLDVRSPGEFRKGHIPHAHNLPLFDNDERALIGTMYKQQSREHAVEKGLEIVGPKMTLLVQQAKQIAPDKQVLLHCWRGGMRSESVAWLLSTAGFSVSLLKGGYKAYRKYVQQQLGILRKLVLIGGFTGSGKTEYLHALAELGEQILDLEGLAHHKGSAFGGVLESAQPSSEHFENQLYEACTKMQVGKRIWVEDESRGLGQVFINDAFFQVMRQSPTIIMECPKEIRVNRLVETYSQAPKDELREGLEVIRRRLGDKRFRIALQALEAGDYATVAREALMYYDKAYRFSLEKKPVKGDLLEWEGGPAEFQAQRLIQFADQLGL